MYCSPRYYLSAEAEKMLVELDLSGSYVKESMLKNIPSEDVISCLNNVKALHERRLSSGSGGKPLIELLGRIVKIPTSFIRNRITKMVTGLCDDGVAGADQIMVLDFLSHLSLEDLGPIVTIAKAIFFNYKPKDPSDKVWCIRNDHCIEGLELISRIKNLGTLLLLDLDNCMSTYQDIENPKKRAICRLMSFDTSEAIEASFDMAGCSPELNQWMESIVKNASHLERAFGDWKRNNSEIRQYNRSLEILNEIIRDNNFDQKQSEAIAALKCFLDFEFKSRKVKTKPDTYGMINACIFNLGGNQYIFDQYNYLNSPTYIIKNLEQIIRIPDHFVTSGLIEKILTVSYSEHVWL